MCGLQLSLQCVKLMLSGEILWSALLFLSLQYPILLVDHISKLFVILFFMFFHHVYTLFSVTSNCFTLLNSRSSNIIRKYEKKTQNVFMVETSYLVGLLQKSERKSMTSAG
jgi:hypothetical protein